MWDGILCSYTLIRGFYELPTGRVSFCASLVREIALDRRRGAWRACGGRVLSLRTGSVWFCDSLVNSRGDIVIVHLKIRYKVSFKNIAVCSCSL